MLRNSSFIFSWENRACVAGIYAMFVYACVCATCVRICAHVFANVYILVKLCAHICACLFNTDYSCYIYINICLLLYILAYVCEGTVYMHVAHVGIFE